MAVELLKEFAESPFDLKQINAAAEYLPNKIVQAWRLKVDQAQEQQEESTCDYIPYGTTLLAVLMDGTMPYIYK